MPSSCKLAPSLLRLNKYSQPAWVLLLQRKVFNVTCTGNWLSTFPVFLLHNFLTQEYFCWMCPISTFLNFGYWPQEIFPCLPQITHTPEFAGKMNPGTVFNCDLVFPDLCKHLCILSVLISALPKAALKHAKGLTRFSPHPFQYVKRTWIFQ